MKLDSARRPVFTGIENILWADVGKSFIDYRDGFYKHTDVKTPDDPPMQVADAPQVMKDWIASKSLLGNSEAETFDDLSFFPVVNPDTDRLNAAAIYFVLGGRISQTNLLESALESARLMARCLHEEEGLSSWLDVTEMQDEGPAELTGTELVANGRRLTHRLAGKLDIKCRGCHGSDTTLSIDFNVWPPPTGGEDLDVFFECRVCNFTQLLWSK